MGAVPIGRRVWRAIEHLKRQYSELKIIRFYLRLLNVSYVHANPTDKILTLAYRPKRFSFADPKDNSAICDVLASCIELVCRTKIKACRISLGGLRIATSYNI